MVKINTTLNDVFKATPLGDVNSAIGTTFFGVNHRQTPNPVPINTDGYGLAFFTRPQLNLTTANLRGKRMFLPLLSKEPASIQRIVRSYLDPRLNFNRQDDYECPFVDHQMAFMPLLTNHITQMAGWQDPVLETFTSKPGAYKEVYGQVDSNMNVYSAYDISATFRNMVSDPITMLMQMWMEYSAAVFEGILVPYPDFIVKNEYDYQTRIYRLVLDKTKRFVQKIACTGASHPVAVNLSSAYNFETDQPLNQSASSVQVNFRSYGACYNDPIIAHEFNKVVGIFNPSMRPQTVGGLPNPALMIPVPMSALSYFNNRGYPYINLDTSELLWYVPLSEYSAVMAAFNRNQEALTANH